MHDNIFELGNNLKYTARSRRVEAGQNVAHCVSNSPQSKLIYYQGNNSSTAIAATGQFDVYLPEGLSDIIPEHRTKKAVYERIEHGMQEAQSAELDVHRHSG